MLLNPYMFQNDKSDNKISADSIEKSGIVYRKRKIYILKKYAIKCFDDKNSIFDNYLMNTVILVNISITKKDAGIYECIKSIYSFKYTGYKNSNILSEFRNSRLILNYCMTSGYECDEIYLSGRYKDSRYYNDLGITFGYDENEDPVEVNIDDICCDESVYLNNEKLSIPDPKYYTVRQYEIDTGNDSEFIMSKNKYYNAYELIDDVSNIFLVSENTEESLNKTCCTDIKGDIVALKDPNSIFELTEIIRDVQLIPFDMFLLNSKSCFTSYKYIYDSKCGYNIKDINSDKNIIKTRNYDYIKMIAKKMKKYCDKLTKVYGPLRLYYYSSDISEQIEIIFEKDETKKITCSFDKNSMFERLMVFVTDRYKDIIQKPLINIDDYYFSA